ncbi:MAG: hypothetical protein M4579_000171 [Chaenotheca gracillima]|nr:MAG: hypothetical protein M4579_000171 [Chaenotheca gracillima]
MFSLFGGGRGSPSRSQPYTEPLKDNQETEEESSSKKTRDSQERGDKDVEGDRSSPQSDSGGRSKGGDDDVQMDNASVADGESIEDEQDDSSLEGERPNKYHGPQSTWRSWTEQEQLLWTSLIQQRDENLSFHLYNAHALKTRLYDREKIAAGPLHVWSGKHRWLKSRQPEEGKKTSRSRAERPETFHPPKQWTAWPLPPDQVPKPGEKRKVTGLEDGEEDERWNIRMVERERPSRTLEHQLAARALRTAKDVFESRLWEGEGSAEDSSAGSGSPGEIHQLRHLEASNEMREKGLNNERRVPVLVHTYTKNIQGQLSLQTMLSLTPFFALPTASKPSRSRTRKGKHKLSQGEESSRRRNRASKSLGRTAMSSKLTLDEEASDVSGTSTDSVIEERRGRSKKPRREPQGSGSDSDVDSQSASSDAPLKKHRRPRRRVSTSPGLLEARSSRLNPRDWSDVLGLAALLGWNPEALRKTQERVESLLGEKMEFRNLKDGEGFPLNASAEGEDLTGSREPIFRPYLQPVLGRDQIYRLHQNQKEREKGKKNIIAS